MKIALINATGSREFPLLEELVNRRHHIAYIAPTRLPSTIASPQTHPVRLEHHHINFDDHRQLVTALQGCQIALVCHSPLPVMTTANNTSLVAACNTAKVPRLIHLNLSHPHPSPRPSPTSSLTPHLKLPLTPSCITPTP